MAIQTVQKDSGDVKYGELIKHTFPLTEDEVNNLHYWQTGCGSCTTVEIDEDKREVIITIDTTKVGGTEGQLYRMHKTVDLFFDSTIAEYVADPITYKKIPNPAKNRSTFIMTANIE